MTLNGLFVDVNLLIGLAYPLGLLPSPTPRQAARRRPRGGAPAPGEKGMEVRPLTVLLAELARVG